MKLVLEPFWRDLLDQSRTAHVATYAERAPGIFVICFAVVEDLVYSPIDGKAKSGRELERLRDIGRDPRVSMLIDRWDEDWQQLGWLRIDARAELVGDDGERQMAIGALRARYPQYRDPTMLADDATILRLSPTRLRRWRA